MTCVVSVVTFFLMVKEMKSNSFSLGLLFMFAGFINFYIDLSYNNSTYSIPKMVVLVQILCGLFPTMKPVYNIQIYIDRSNDFFLYLTLMNALGS